MSTAAKLLTVSFTINMSVAIFHFLPRVLLVISQKFRERSACARQLLNLHEEKSWILGKFLVDQLSSLVITILAVIVLAVSGVIFNPFMEMPTSVQTVVAVDVGHYGYKLAQDFYLRKHFPSFKINALHHIVTILVLAVFLFFEQNGLNSLIGVMFEGNTIFFGISHFMKEMQVEKYSMSYGLNLYCGFVSTFLLRGLIPLAFLIVSLLYGNPFSMSYVAIAFYFLSCIFFLILNLWLIKISFSSVQKFRRERKRYKLECALIKSPRDEESHIENVGGALPMANKSQLHCQKKNNVRYLTPVANTNINADTRDGRITNLNRDRATVTNIRDALFSDVASNPLQGTKSNSNSSISSSSDSAGSFTAIDLDLRNGNSNQSPRSVYYENIRLGAVRSPPDGEDAKNIQPPVYSHMTKPPAPEITEVPIRPPRRGAPHIKMNRNLSDGSITERSRVNGGGNESRNDVVSVKSLPPPALLPTIPPPQNYSLNNVQRCNAHRTRSDPSTIQVTHDSNANRLTTCTRTRIRSGETRKSSVTFPEDREIDGASNS